MTNDRLFDVRVLERNLHKGLISRVEFDKYVTALADAEANSTPISAEFIEGVLLDNDEEE